MRKNTKTYRDFATKETMRAITVEEYIRREAIALSEAQSLLQHLQSRPELFSGLQLTGLIGDGPTGQSVVCQGLWRGTAAGPVTPAVPVAVKIFLKVGEDAIHEVSLLQRCDHENIMKSLFVFDHNGIKAIVLPLATRSLADAGMLTKAGDIAKYALHVARGLRYLHEEMKVCHLDVKAGNMLMFGEVIRIADFGLCASFRHGVSTRIRGCGTPGFTSPEVLFESLKPARPNPSGDWTKVDVYAFGCLLWEMMAGQAPYQREAGEVAGWDEANEKVVRRHSPGDMIDAHWRSDARRQLCDLVVRCCVYNPAERPPFTEIVAELEATGGGGAVAAAAAAAAVSTVSVNQVLQPHTLSLLFFLCLCYSFVNILASGCC